MSGETLRSVRGFHPSGEVIGGTRDIACLQRVRPHLQLVASLVEAARDGDRGPQTVTHCEQDNHDESPQHEPADPSAGPTWLVPSRRRLERLVRGHHIPDVVVLPGWFAFKDWAHIPCGGCLGTSGGGSLAGITPPTCRGGDHDEDDDAPVPRCPRGLR